MTSAQSAPRQKCDARRSGRGWLLAGYTGAAGFFVQEQFLRQPGSASSLNASRDDDGTTRLLLASSALAYGVPLVLRRLPLPMMPASAAATGLIMQACGLTLRVWSMRALGSFYTRGAECLPGRLSMAQTSGDEDALKQYIIGSPAVSMHEQAQLYVLESLLERLLAWATAVPSLSQLPMRLRAYLSEMGLDDQSHEDGPELRRAIVDYLCSLTDDECIDLHGRLTRVQPPIVTKT